MNISVQYIKTHSSMSSLRPVNIWTPMLSVSFPVPVPVPFPCIVNKSISLGSLPSLSLTIVGAQKDTTFPYLVSNFSDCVIIQREYLSSPTQQLIFPDGDKRRDLEFYFVDFPIPINLASNSIKFNKFCKIAKILELYIFLVQFT